MNRLILSITGFFFLVMAAATAHGATVGSVTALEGRADITPPGGRAVALRLGDSVDQGDIVRTKSRSKAEITFEDGSIVRLAASSRVRVDEYTMGKGKDRGILKLFRGKIQSIVKKSRGLFGFGKRNRFEVHTPTAVCGVRGTNYFSSYQAGASNFVFKEGSGYGYSLNRPEQVMLIETGQAMSLTGADRKPILRPASEAELKQHSEDTDAGESEGGQDEDGGEGDSEAPVAGQDDADTKPDDGGEEAGGEDSGADADGTADEDASDSAPDGDARGDAPRSDDGGDDAGAQTPGEDGGPVAAGTSPQEDARNGEGDGMRAEGGSPSEGGGIEKSPAPGGYGSESGGPEGDAYGDAGSGGSGSGGGTYADAGVGDYGPDGGPQSDSGPDGGMYGDAGHGDSGPDGGMYVDSGRGDYGPDGGMYGDAGPGDYGPDGGMQGDSGRGDYGPDGGMYGDASPVGYGSEMDGPHLGGDAGIGIYEGGDGYRYNADPGMMPATGSYDPMGATTGLYDINDPGLYAGDAGIYQDPMTDPVYMSSNDPYYYDPMTDPMYTSPDDYFYDPPTYDTAETVSELEVMHTVSWDANGNPGIALSGTFDANLMAPPAMGIEMIEGPIDNFRYFMGAIGGVWYGGSVEGDLWAMYIGTDGSAGVMKADWNGTYAADNTWTAGWTPLSFMEMAAFGVPYVAAQPVPEPSPIYFDNINGTYFPAGGGDIVLGAYQDEKMGAYLHFADQDWGVWRVGLWGQFSGTPDSNWIVATQNNASGGMAIHQWMEFIGDQWSSGQIHARVAGAWVDLNDTTTGIVGGELNGVYDPSDPMQFWDAVAGGASLETSRFLAMVNGTTADRTLVESLGLPSFEVGSATLSGSDSLMNVSMNNVTFFSFASGGAPRVWATDDVTGSCSAVPEAYHTVALSGGGLSADFMVREWRDGAWAAEVTSTGTGTLTRTDTTGTVDMGFAGGAAGTYTAGGAFSGTAAGVAKPVVSGPVQ